MPLAFLTRSKHVVLSALFLSSFIIPFVVFGHTLEQFARAFLAKDQDDLMAMLLAGSLLAADAVLPTPSSVIATLLAAKTGFWPAALVNAFSLSLGCVVAFLLGRGGGAAMARTGRALPPGFVDWVQRHGLVAVLLCRPVPVLAEASLIVAGAARHEPRLLLAWCCASQTLLGVAYAFAGSGWGSGHWNNFAVLFGAVVAPLSGAAIVAIALRRSVGQDMETTTPERAKDLSFQPDERT